MGKRSRSFSKPGFKGGRKRDFSSKLDSRKLNDWKEFGESHPIDDEEFKNFKPNTAAGAKYNPSVSRPKKVKLDQNSRPQEAKVQENVDSGSSSESEAETESQPYDQLLTMLRGTSTKSTAAVSDESQSDEEETIEQDVSEEEELSDEDNEIESEDDDKSTKNEAAKSSNWEIADDPSDTERPNEEVSSDELTEDESDTEQNVSNDPLFCHFERELPDNLVSTLTSAQAFKMEKMAAPTLGKLIVYLPNIKEESNKKQKTTLKLADNQEYAQPGTAPNFAKLPEIKTQLKSNMKPLTPFQAELLTILSDYKDLYFPERSFTNEEEIRQVYCMHALNHVLKTWNRVLQHNAKLKKAADNGRSEEYRDQGLVRPRVLFVAPFRSSAQKIVHTLGSILLPPEKGQIMNKNRFEEEYGTGDKNESKEETKKHYKPLDFEELFKGNIDDSFRIGLSVSKRSLRLYTGFYHSDILIASPLGLRTLLADDFDFLSSIEILILDQTDVLLMQNWDHVMHLFDHLHLQPREQHGTDLSRVRFWALNGWAAHYRQTLIYSSTQLPEAVALFLRKGTNFAGKVRVENPVAQNAATISRVVAQLPQAFRRFDTPSAAKAAENRFDFFVKKILPQYRESLMSGTLVFVPSYFDYVRLRNYFHNQELNFAQACEYTPDGKLAQARSRFFTSKKRIMLYTERLHFYRRLTIKGIRHIIFYQLPTYAHFYPELCNLLQDLYQQKKNRGDGSSFTCTVLYCAFDAPRLNGVVGTQRAAQMITSDRNVHMFVSGES